VALSRRSLLDKNSKPVGFEQLDYLIVREIKRSNILVDKTISDLNDLRHEFETFWENLNLNEEQRLTKIKEDVKKRLKQASEEYSLFEAHTMRDLKYKEKLIKHVVVDLSLLKKRIDDDLGNEEHLPNKVRKKDAYNTFSIPENSSFTTEPKTNTIDPSAKTLNESIFEEVSQYSKKSKFDMKECNILHVRPSSQISKFFRQRKRYHLTPNFTF